MQATRGTQWSSACWMCGHRVNTFLLFLYSLACSTTAALQWPGRMQATRAGAVEQRVLEALAARRCPRLVAALARADAPLTALAAPWFPALFAGALPAETVARVWDCLMLEGPKVLFRVALALATVLSCILFGKFLVRLLNEVVGHTWDSLLFKGLKVVFVLLALVFAMVRRMLGTWFIL